MQKELDGKPIRVLLADAQSLFREALKAGLSGAHDIEVAGEAATGTEAVVEASLKRPDLAVLSADLTDCSCTRAIRLIHERVPDCRIVVLADVGDPATLLDSLEAGASGYLTKESPLEELMDSLRTISQGETLVPQRLVGGLLSRLIRDRRTQEEALARISRLTPRERQVLGLLSEGADNESIAWSLVISRQTVRTHIQNVLSKLGFHSRLEAVAYILQNGLLEELLHPLDGRSGRATEGSEPGRLDSQTVASSSRTPVR